jgi:hypothetical protein
MGDGGKTFDWRPNGLLHNQATIAILTLGDGVVVFEVPEDVKFYMGGTYGNIVKGPYNLFIEPGASNPWASARLASMWEGNNQERGNTLFNAVTGMSCSGSATALPAGPDRCDGCADNAKCGGGGFRVTCSNGHKAHQHCNVFHGDPENCKYCRFSLCEGEMNLLSGSAILALPAPNNIAQRGHNANFPINNSVFIVSNGNDSTGAHIQVSDRSVVAGFIYAPRLTYRHYSPDGGIANHVILLGGMVVADYDFVKRSAIIGVKPDSEFLSGLISRLAPTGRTGGPMGVVNGTPRIITPPQGSQGWRRV